MLKVAVNDPSENSFLTVGQNINQRITEMFVTKFFAFINDTSHIKVSIVLKCIVRAQFKLSNTHSQNTRAPISILISSCQEILCPWLKISYLRELLKKIGISLFKCLTLRQKRRWRRERRRENTIIALDNNLSHANSSLIAIQVLSAGNRHT